MRLPSRVRTALLRTLGLWREEQWGRTSFSQEGEDVMLWRVLEHLPLGDGIYVEVGSNHPWLYSNTAFFYQRGWSGVAIDPLPNFATAYARERPRDRFLNVGIAARPGRQTLYRFSESCYSTFSAERAAELRSQGVGGRVEERAVEVLPLHEALSRVWPEGRRLDLLSIDTEGMDEEVLRSHDFARFPASVVLVEHESLPVAQASQEPVSRLLAAKGYLHLAKLVKTGVFFAPPLAEALGL